jgi:hypothetical protein
MRKIIIENWKLQQKVKGDRKKEEEREGRRLDRRSEKRTEACHYLVTVC